MHRDLIFKENPVWIKSYGVVIRVVRYLVKARAWRGIGFVVVFVVGPGVVLFLFLSLACFVVNVHT